VARADRPLLRPRAVPRAVHDLRGGGAGIAENEFAVSTGLLVGDQTRQRFAWQVLAGGRLRAERAHVALRGLALPRFRRGQDPARRLDAHQPRRYSMDLDANEFTVSLAIWFYRLPPLLGEE
jgi:hypothetical protein